MKFVLLAILVVLLSLGSLCRAAVAQCTGPGCPIRPPAVDPDFPTRQLRGAVVRIVAQVGNSQCYGTGTVVDLEGLLDDALPQSDWCTIVSCAHVFEDSGATVSVYFADGSQAPATLVELDRRSDLSILLARKPQAATPRLVVATEPAQAGEPIVKFGFDSSGQLRCVSANVLGYARTSTNSRHETLVLSRRSYPGESGGPIFNQEGELTGVIWGTDATRTMGTYCGSLRAFVGRIASRLRERLGRMRRPPKDMPEHQGNPPAEYVPGQFSQADQGAAHLREALSRLEAGLGRQSLDLHRRFENQNRQLESRIGGVGSDLRNIRERLHHLSGASASFPRHELLLTVILSALGISAPPTAVLVALKGLLWIRRRRKQRRSFIPSMPSTPREEPLRRQLNDDYAKQLNALMQTYGGRTTDQDATLGRTYDQELAKAAQSSDGAIAGFASRLRRSAHDVFDRIHAQQPLPAEPSASHS